MAAWTRNDDGTHRCNQCGCASFVPPAACECPVGSSAGSSELVGLTAMEADTIAAPVELPTSDSALRQLAAVAWAAARNRKAIRKAEFMGEHWQAVKSYHAARSDALEAERKAWQTVYEATLKRELPEYVERLEQTVKGLKRRRSRLAADTAEAGEVH